MKNISKKRVESLVENCEHSILMGRTEESKRYLELLKVYLGTAK